MRLSCFTWRFRKLLLDIYCLASEMGATSIIPMLSTMLLLSRMTRALIMMPPHSIKIFAIETFANCPINSQKFSPVKDSHYTVSADSIFCNGEYCLNPIHMYQGKVFEMDKLKQELDKPKLKLESSQTSVAKVCSLLYYSRVH